MRTFVVLSLTLVEGGSAVSQSGCVSEQARLSRRDPVLVESGSVR
jgi:hypothetical protein